MGHWNYRVCKQYYKFPETSGGEDGEYEYSLREVYYNEDGSIWATSGKPQAPQGETLEDLKDGVSRMQRALDKDVIDLDTIEYKKPDFEDDEDDAEGVAEETQEESVAEETQEEE